jgi:hypothetical protein
MKALAAIAVLAGLVPGKAQAGDFQEVSCVGFPVSYDGAADKQHCYEAEVSATRAKRLVIHSPTYLLLATYYDSGFRHYFVTQPMDKLMASSGMFASPRKVYDGPGGNGYAVAVFAGEFADHKGHGACALFVRYYGEPGKVGGEVAPYEFPSGPGAKFMVQGFYCPYGRKELTLGAFLQEVQQVLPRIHAPS